MRHTSQVRDPETVPTVDALADHFGLFRADPVSLTPFGRVYRAVTRDGESVVMKCTGQRTALALAAWTRQLDSTGVSVVTPARLDHRNPSQVEGQWWVVYPFIEGETYTATPGQIVAAGDLLGRMHTATVDTTGLRSYTWPTAEADEITATCQKMATTFADYAGPDAALCTAALADLGRRYSQNLPSLRAAELPTAAVSSDFKANNLVYTATGPVMVDPDNGGLEPRLLDLALAVALFHNECSTAPARLFTRGEWDSFIDGYLTHVTLTATERRFWPAALDHILWDEGTWALEDNDPTSWTDPHQCAFLIDLARTDPTRYPLPEPRTT